MINIMRPFTVFYTGSAFYYDQKHPFSSIDE